MKKKTGKMMATALVTTILITGESILLFANNGNEKGTNDESKATFSKERKVNSLSIKEKSEKML